MLKKIYQKLMRKKRTASGGKRPISEKELSHLRKHAGSSESVVLAGQKPLRREKLWWRFELLTENEQETIRLEDVLNEKNLSRQDLAIILFGLRVRSGFEKKDFGI